MDSIAVLDNAIIEMMQTQVILADKGVKNVLKALSASEDYCRTIKECVKGFDFDREFCRYFEEEHSIPNNSHVLIALITGILYKIDSGKINILDLLKTAYPDMDTTKSYTLFLKDYIIPFVDAINLAAFGHPYDDVKLPKAGTYDKMKEEISWAVNRIIKERLSDNESDMNDELFTMLNGLSHSINFCDNQIIKVAYIGLKNTLIRYSINLGEELLNIKNILSIYGVM